MSLGNRRFARAISDGRVFTALLMPLSAALAALVAHVGIDVLGDYLLVHDAYDSVAHTSRAVASCTVVVVLAAALLALLGSIVRELRAVRPERAARAVVRQQNPAYFFLISTAATIGLLVAMEAGDLLLGGQPVGDIGDLLGGSIPLGLAVTVPAALSCAFAVRRAARWAITARGAAVRIIRALVLMRPRSSARAWLSQREELRRIARAPALSRSASKRGPPFRSR